MEDRSSPPNLNWKLWLWWTVATAAASIPFYFLPTLPAARDLFPREAWGLDFLYLAAMGAGSVAVAGVAQWLVLRQYFQKAWTWILACTVGGAIGMIASWAVMWTVVLLALAIATAGFYGGGVGWAAVPLLVVCGGTYGAASGAVVGIAQWLVLRRQVRRAGWWVVASIALGFFANPLVPSSGWASVGTILGLFLPGLVLAFLIGPQPPTSALPVVDSPGDSLSR